MGPLAAIGKTWIIAREGHLRNFDPEPDVEISLARLALETLVKDQSPERLLGKDSSAHRALPGKVPLSSQGRQAGAGKVEHECRVTLLASQLQPAEFRVGDRELFLAHGATILGKRPAECNWMQDLEDAASAY